MKTTGRTALCLLLALLLVAGGLLYGARKGWQAEADGVSALYAAEGGLRAMLALRAADASNLLQVAARHLPPGDELLSALSGARDTLGREEASLSEKYAANRRLTQAVEALSPALAQSDSFPEDTRDQNYVTTLTQALNSYEGSGAAQAYNEAAEAFNRRKGRSPSGLAAGLMGVPDAPLFAQ